MAVLESLYLLDQRRSRGVLVALYMILAIEPFPHLVSLFELHTVTSQSLIAEPCASCHQGVMSGLSNAPQETAIKVPPCFVFKDPQCLLAPCYYFI